MIITFEITNTATPDFIKNIIEKFSTNINRNEHNLQKWRFMFNKVFTKRKIRKIMKERKCKIMNKQESDILNTLLLEPFINQRILAEVSGHSLGVVNRSLKELIKADYLDESIRPTVKAITEFKQKTPQRAVILAAGFGMRMVPINTEMPKGLLKVNGEPLIERIIKQLHEVGIKEIYVVVGFMKEKYEYLIDEYCVELVVNADYAAKNNLHSIKLVKEHLENAYIIPCDDVV